MEKGIGASKGYGIGKVVVYRPADLHYTPKTGCDPETEKKRLAFGKRRGTRRRKSSPDTS